LKILILSVLKIFNTSIFFLKKQSEFDNPSYWRKELSASKQLRAKFTCWSGDLPFDLQLSTDCFKTAKARAPPHPPVPNLRFDNSATFVLPRCSCVTRRRSQRLLNVGGIVHLQRYAFIT